MPLGASGSSQISTKLCVPSGMSFHESGGETPSPSHVNRGGKIPPSSKAVLETFISFDPPLRSSNNASPWPCPHIHVGPRSSTRLFDRGLLSTLEFDSTRSQVFDSAMCVY